MMFPILVRRREISRVVFQAIRAKSTSLDNVKTGPLGDDGRHELWREGIYDHDNEPK
jgi:hypothetical protein